MRTESSKVSRPVFFLALLPIAGVVQGCGPVGQTIQVDATPSHALNSFSPLRALGTSVDRIPSNATDVFFTPASIREGLSAGWGAITYRQNTELFCQAWHWNPKGTWSDPSGKGYFTGDSTPTQDVIRHSYGYSLPHRGVTRNEGTEFDGYSRLDDGNLETYWKSNPYLSREYTGEDDATHPQWLVIDLEKKQQVDAIRIAWGEPYATSYEIQYWTGENAVSIYAPPDGEWRTFASGVVSNGAGGTVSLKVAASPILTRSVRVWMTQSSNTCDTHGTSDRRNCLGYAVKEVYLGTTDSTGRFHDLMRHSPDQRQSPTYCSSVDPWHEPTDLYVAPNRMESGDQPGLDLLYTSGITRGLPAMIPVSILYGTPEDAAAQLGYLKRRGYPISHVELGEEAEGQYMLPEDYGALYLQWATALHGVDPLVKLGGPSFTGSPEDITVWPDSRGRTSWLARFLGYLKSHGRQGELAFLSLEHYPGDGCDTPWTDLYREPNALVHVMRLFKDDGLPPNLPMFVTEINAHGGDAAVDIYGALFIADTFAGFLTAGGKAIYYYHGLPYSPAHPICPNSWGTYHMFTIGRDYQIKKRTSEFFAAQLITQEWVVRGDAEHRLYRASSDVADAAGNVLMTSYAVLRPDGQWSLLIVNKDFDRPHPVRIVFSDSESKAVRSFAGPVAMTTYGKAQYRWHSAGRDGYAAPDDPPQRSSIRADRSTVYVLPAASITVLRGSLD